MEQSRALNALAPFLALAKSANSPRAAADLVVQATSAPNTFVFAELLQQPNIRALAGHEQFNGHYELLKCFAWGTWQDLAAKSASTPPLTDAQALKLRMLSLLTIAAERNASGANLSYAALSAHLGLASPIDLEHLVTQAIYSDLLTATLDPAHRTVVITSVSPLRDLAPGSVPVMIADLEKFSARCNDALGALEKEIARVKMEAARRHARDQKAERQIRAVTEAGEKTGGGGGGGGGKPGASRGGHNRGGGGRGGGRVEHDLNDYEMMDVDGGSRKRSGGNASGIFSKMTGGRGR